MSDILELSPPKKNDIFGNGQRVTTHTSELSVFKNDNCDFKLNDKNTANGLDLLNHINDGVIATVFFDPQYRGVMDKLSYGNEGSRQIGRIALSQMPNEMIIDFISHINRVLRASGHLFLWVDKFHLCEGITDWLIGTDLEIVDLIIWHKMTFGMGYRSRRTSEYLIVLQKKPKRAKGLWTIRNIPDVWSEKIVGKSHPHQKPFDLQKRLIEATTDIHDIVLDPASGSFSVLSACQELGRQFIGCDIGSNHIQQEY
jgi:site-specific DNA-methyltransferase (adenine-specific)